MFQFAKKNISLATPRDFLVFGCLGLFLVAVGYIVGDASLFSLLTIAIVWCTVNCAWNLVIGFAGVFSFGQVAFFASGAYVAAIFNVHLGLPPYLTVLLAPLGGGIAAVLIGLAAIRLRGIYVALVTLAFHELLRTIVSTDYSGLTGGPNGLTVERFLPGASALNQARLDYAIGVGIFLFCGALVLRLLAAPFGLALVADRDAEHVATARGVNRQRYQMSAFVLSGCIAGLAGGFYAHYIGVVAPTIISFALVMDLFAMVVVGGIGTFWGPILGTVVISTLTVYIQGSYAKYQPVAVAGVLILIVLFFQGGLIGILRDLRRRRLRHGGA